MGTPFDFFPYHTSEIPFLLPCTLFTKERSLISDLLFAFCFPFIDDDDRLAIYLTQLVWLEKIDPSLIYTMFDELTTYFQEERKISLYLELQKISSSQSLPAYPTSLTHFSYDISELFNNNLLSNDFDQLRDAGFKDYVNLLCYECDIATLQNTLSKLNEKQQYEIIEDFPGKNLTILLRDPTSEMVAKTFSITNSLAFISNQNVLDIVDQGLTIFKDEQLMGFFQWIPNLLELPSNTVPTPFLYSDQLQSYSFTTGKIFRFGIRIEDEGLFNELLHKTALIMRENGIKKCQIGYIDEQNKFLSSLLNQIGFKVNHSLQILKKDVK
jgi:hypothetical protein